MWILSENKTQLLESSGIELLTKDIFGRIIATVDEHNHVILGEYNNEQEQEEVFLNLVSLIRENKLKYYEMPKENKPASI